MIFHENCLPADDSHELSYLICLRKLGKMLQNLSSAAVVIGALNVKFLKSTPGMEQIHQEAVSLKISQIMS